MTNQERAEAILADLVAFPSVSSASNLDIALYLETVLTQAGARIERQTDPSGAKVNLFATIGPDAPGGVVLSGHMDVVPVEGQAWSSDPFTLTERDGRLYGRGACDMKGFIACAVALAPTFAAAGLTRPIHYALTYDEETGCQGAEALAAKLEADGLAAEAVIVGEPTEMRIVSANKGCYEYTTRFSGLEGHGSLPDRAVNAVQYAIAYATRLMTLGAELKARAPAGSAFTPPWTTVSIGRIDGGVAHNVIPHTCLLDWEMRPVRAADAAFVKDAMAAYVAAELLPAMRAVHPQAAIELETIGEIVGLEPTPENAAVGLLTELTGGNAEEAVSFGTEAGLFQEIGLPTAVCGPGSIAQAHKPDEYVARSELSRCLAMLERLAERMRA